MLLTIDVTGKCNLTCATCYNAEFSRFSPPPESIFSIIDSASPDTSLYFLGGEPLVRSDFIDILARSKQRGHHTSFSTNATLIDDTRAADIISTGVDAIYISLDGSSPEQNDAIRGAGTFNRAIRGIQLLDQAIHRVSGCAQICISVTATASNASSIRKIPTLLDEMGVYVEKVGVTPVALSGRARDSVHFKLSPSQWLDLCDDLCADWKQWTRLCYLCLPNPELAIRYLSVTSGLLLVESISDCQVLSKRDMGRILPTGEVVPCSGRLDKLRRYNAEASNSASANVQSLDWRSFHGFDRFVEDLRPYLKCQAPVCLNCSFAADCEICPLERMYGGDGVTDRVDLCTEVLRRVATVVDVPTSDHIRLHEEIASMKGACSWYRKKKRQNSLFFFPKSQKIADTTPFVADSLEALLNGETPATIVLSLLADGHMPDLAVRIVDAALKTICMSEQMPTLA